MKWGCMLMVLWLKNGIPKHKICCRLNKSTTHKDAAAESLHALQQQVRDTTPGDSTHGNV